MSQSPSLEQYPGYFPPTKPPFWNRTKAAIVAGVAGLVIGLLAGAGGPAATEQPAADDERREVVAEPEISDDDVADQIEDAVAEEAARMQEKLDRQRANAQERLASAKVRAEKAAERAVRQAVAQVRATEREKAARAVAAAEAEAQQPAPAPVASGGGATDPRFNYCYEANDAGYGPYHQGQDPEYDWYDDADNDGSVCE